jgi:hypothetical protein
MKTSSLPPFIKLEIFHNLAFESEKQVPILMPFSAIEAGLSLYDTINSAQYKSFTFQLERLPSLSLFVPDLQALSNCFYCLDNLEEQSVNNVRHGPKSLVLFHNPLCNCYAIFRPPL